jgi:hypothetical protein
VNQQVASDEKGSGCVKTVNSMLRMGRGKNECNKDSMPKGLS